MPHSNNTEKQLNSLNYLKSQSKIDRSTEIYNFLNLNPYWQEYLDAKDTLKILVQNKFLFQRGTQIIKVSLVQLNHNIKL